MSLFNWFSGKSLQDPSTADRRAKQVSGGRDVSPAMPQRSALEAGSQEQKRKLERYARREQLYIAIREAMTRAGILSASYKFKVLSLDRRDSEFLVMVDMSRIAGDLSVKTVEMETLIVHNAKARFDLAVSAVYWRLNAMTEASKRIPYSPEESVIVKTDRKSKPAVHESIQADEMAAFQHALRGGGVAASGPVLAADQERQSRGRGNIPSRPRRAEELEASDSVSPRSLSGTQYGDLN